ncbi:hypothetical protein [Pseudocolwellia agarivorans]|uniref:hypothetical protein n=1 Tax=Pseudocolwellia agarivorans TaxID=1911682 RepID=UPI0009871A99|nr:hypothetical protein [Pseudocolwellia agarivorans]
MDRRILSSVVFVAFSISALGCQNQQTISVDDNNQTTGKVSAQSSLPIPCKNYSSPLVKDKSKIKDMLFKEGKLNKTMTEEEITQYVNDFIKKKNKSCKSQKLTVITPLLEKIHYA